MIQDFCHTTHYHQAEYTSTWVHWNVATFVEKCVYDSFNVYILWTFE